MTKASASLNIHSGFPTHDCIVSILSPLGVIDTIKSELLHQYLKSST